MVRPLGFKSLRASWTVNYKLKTVKDSRFLRESLFFASFENNYLHFTRLFHFFDEGFISSIARLAYGGIFFLKVNIFRSFLPCTLVRILFLCSSKLGFSIGITPWRFTVIGSLPTITSSSMPSPSGDVFELYPVGAVAALTSRKQRLNFLSCGRRPWEFSGGVIVRRRMLPSSSSLKCVFAKI